MLGKLNWKGLLADRVIRLPGEKVLCSFMGLLNIQRLSEGGTVAQAGGSVQFLWDECIVECIRGCIYERT